MTPEMHNIFSWIFAQEVKLLLSDPGYNMHARPVKQFEDSQRDHTENKHSV